jgi:hypothetical protein
MGALRRDDGNHSAQGLARRRALLKAGPIARLQFRGLKGPICSGSLERSRGNTMVTVCRFLQSLAV